MDARLSAADARMVARDIARQFLAGAVIADALGSVRLAPHQVDAVQRLTMVLDAHGGALLADATGLGKTYVALALAREAPSVLVVAPAALRAMWLDAAGRAGVAVGFSSYEALSHGARPGRAPFVILDEAHHARNPASRRYEALAALTWGARVLLLTATPIHNRARDLRHLIALFLGTAAHALGDEEVSRFIVRRTAGGPHLPRLAGPQWLPLREDEELARHIASLPPTVPFAGAGTADALVVLGLLRAWMSSDGALRATLRRRLVRATAMTAALEAGAHPGRRELASWVVGDSSVQLALPGLMAGSLLHVDAGRLQDALAAHVEGIRRVLRALDERAGSADRERSRLLAELHHAHRGVPIIAFTQFADTATALFQAMHGMGGVALVTGRGARIASGTVNQADILDAFDRRAPGARAMPLELLIATDVLSEGLSLRRAGVLVHLDLPWTIARLEQRVGRLRRPGSAHAIVRTCAIGPPITSRTMARLIRPLQRKARAEATALGVAGDVASMPLLGQRLRTATARIGRAPVGGVEEMRRCLSAWRDGCFAGPPTLDADGLALALVRRGRVPMLLVVRGGEVLSDPGAAATTVRAFGALLADTSPATHAIADARANAALATLLAWCAHDQARLLIQPALEGGVAHAAALRVLQQAIDAAPRHVRVSVAQRIARCRDLVLATRGAGAERALARWVEASARGTDLDALERLLTPHVSAPANEAPARVVALLVAGQEPPGVMGYRVNDGAETSP